MAYDTALLLFGLVAALLALAHVVHEILRDLAEGPTFLSKIHHDARAAALRRLDALLDGMGQVRSTRADVAPKHIGAITLVVDAYRELHIFVFDLAGVAPDVGLSGNQISGARRHRCDVVSTTASAR